MLSVSNVSLSKGRSYYEKENYYSKESAKEHSQWHGKLAEDLGLKGQIDFNTFDNLLFGIAPNGKSISTNSVDPKLYREPEITKQERGNLEFSIAKICEKYPFKESEYKKINDIIKYQIRHNKKITADSKKTCLSHINRVVKSTGLSPLQREEAKQAIEAAILKVTRPKERRAGYDLTFSAPKSVSIVGLVGKDNDVIKAHREAVFDVLNFIEAKYANTRTGDNLKREIENTKKLLIAQFEHNTSRENDPQLHTHCVVLNLIQRMDGEWRSLHADDFRNHSKLFGTIYQNQLAKRVYELGYDISPDKDSTFKISNVPNELCEKFSKRRKQLVELGVSDQKSARDLVYLDRAKKSQNVSESEQHKKWINETKEIGTDLSKIRGKERKSIEFEKEKIIEIIHDSFREASKMKMAFKYEEALQIFAKYSQGKLDIIKASELFENEVNNKLIKLNNGMFITKEALEMEQKTIQNLENQHSVKSILNLKTNAIDNLIKEKASFSLDKKNALIQEVVEKTKHLNPDVSLHIAEIMKHFIKEDRRISFQENEHIKSFISETIKDLKIIKSEKKELKANLNYLIDKATELTEGQKEAIKQTLSTTDKHIIWLGAAGAGKTFSLTTIVEQAKLAGYQVEGFAQNKKAADVLAQEANMEVNTIASLLLKGSQATNKEKIWIIDEAGMVGTKLGHDFVAMAKKENARLIIVGDNRQLSSPTAGHFLKLVTNYTNIKKVELNKSLRQKDENLAKGVEILNSMLFNDLSKQNYKLKGKNLIDEALGYFKNSIHEFKTEEARVSNLVKEFLSYSQIEKDKTLIVAKTHKAIAEITNQIRENLKKEGLLKNEISTNTFTAVDLSESKGKYATSYELGNLIIFDSDNKIHFENKTFKVLKNEEYKIIKTDHIQNSITIENKEGKLFSFNPSKFKYDKPQKSNDFSLLPVYKKSEIKICENDKLSWSKNVWQTNRVNKKEFKVLKIDKTNNIMNIVYNNGKMESIDLKAMNFIQHNWAVTYNAAQGDTKKNVLGIVDGISSIEDIYTVFTRPTHNLKVFVESEKKLKSSMERSGSKKTAMELVHNKKEDYLITKSYKMDFYDKYQRSVSLHENKVILSFAAPSDITSMIFSHEKEKTNVLSAHKKAVKQTLDKFNQLTGKEFLYTSNTKDILFDKKDINLSKIPYLNTNIEVIGEKDNLAKQLNSFTFIENQGVLKNLYQNFLSENLMQYNINCFNENGILRIKERNDHIHATFSEEFEKNIKLLENQFKGKGFNKFASPYEIEKFTNQYKPSNDKNKILEWDKITKEDINNNEKKYLKIDKNEIQRNTIHSLCKNLQVFNEVKLYETLLNESKGHISIDEINQLQAELLTHSDLKMIDYDKFGKMIFAHKDLNHDEAKILMHSAARNDEKDFILSFERVLRRAESKRFSHEQIAALAHCTLDQGNVKFLSGLNDKEAKQVINETTNLYKNSSYKVFNIYAGNQVQTNTILNSNKDFHLGYLLNKIYDKKISLDENTVLIIKDLGNNITQNASILFDMAKEKGSKIIFHVDENDFKDGEKKSYLKNLKNIAGINLKQRYAGIEKQQTYYNNQEKSRKDVTLKTTLTLKQEEKKEIIQEEKRNLHTLMNDIKEFYTNNLFSNEGKEALDYLHKRGFSNEQIKEYGLGLSFTKGVENFAIEKGYTQKDLIQLSLITQKEDGSKYDFYRNRVMIPIKDAQGNCIGFGGRIYRDLEVQKQVSKYINPKNNILFDKKTTLFGLDTAKEYIKTSEKVYIVEGYMDAIAMQKAGIKNVVAVMGTSLTKENIDQLSKITKDAILLFDNDKAGHNAAKLSYIQAVDSNLSLSYTSITKEKDPDEYIKRYGAENFKNEIQKNTIPLEYFVNNLYRNENHEVGYQEIRQWRKEILPSILKIDDPIRRNLELKGASISLNQPLTYLLEEKHFKYIPEAFLNEDEVSKRREYFSRIHKSNNVKRSFKEFDNTLNSKLSSKKIFNENELNNGINFEMKNKGLDYTDKTIKMNFIEENKHLISNLKEQIEFNELLISDKLKSSHNKVNYIDIYKHIKEEFKNHSPQEISDKLFKEQSEKQKEQNNEKEFLSAHYHTVKILDEIGKGAIKDELELVNKQYNNPNILNYLSFKYVTQQLDKLNSLSLEDSKEKEIHLKSIISIDNFKSYLQNHRLENAVKYQEELKNHITKDIKKELEKNSNLYDKFNSLDFKDKEFINSKVFPNQIDKNQSINNNMTSIDNKFNSLNMNKENTFKKFSSILNEFHLNKEHLRKTNTLEMDKFSLEKTKENSKLKENLKAFEEKLISDISSKIKNKDYTRDVFLETRKTLIKESKFMSKVEKSPEKAYFNLAKEENINKFRDIITDLNLSKFETNISKKYNSQQLNVTAFNKETKQVFKSNQILNNIQKSESFEIKNEKGRDSYFNNLAKKAGLNIQYKSSEQIQDKFQQNVAFNTFKISNDFNNHFNNNKMANSPDNKLEKRNEVSKSQVKSQSQQISK